MSLTEVPLGDVADLVRGITFPTSAKKRAAGKGLIPCLRTTNVQDAVEWEDLIYVPNEYVRSEAQRVRAGDILVSMSNSIELVGKCALVTNVPVPATFGAFIAVIRAREGIDPEYIFHAMRSPKFKAHIRSVASTTTNISNINSTKLLASNIVLEGDMARKAIVSKLNELFSLIDEGERAVERVSTLVARYRQSVLKAAVTGELTRDWREARKGAGHPIESGEALLTRILNTRREAWEEAELAKLQAKGITPQNDVWKKKYKEPSPPDAADLPELPDGWIWASLGQLTKELGQGWSPQCASEPVSEDGQDWGVIKTTAVQAMRYEASANKALPSNLEPRPSLEVRPGDLLVTRAGPRSRVGITCLVRSTRQRLMICDKVYRLRLPDKLVSPDYVEIVLNSPPLLEELEKLKSGINDSGLNLTQERFLALTVPFPPLREQARIADVVAETGSEADSAAMHASISGDSLRQAILKLAFCGKLVAQSDNDEPASVLIERIAAERDEPNITAPRRGRQKKSV